MTGRARRRALGLLLGTALWASAAAPARAWTPAELWQAWEDERWVSTPARCLRSSHLRAELQRLAERHGDRLDLRVVGRSFEGKPIHLLTLGRGGRKVLLWSQMHGDEPSATPALLDLADFLLRRSAAAGAATNEPDPATVTILDELTLLMVPMLNPDGADHASRRNAQGIDVNRDALALVTPEGRLLAALRDEHEPILGFNLHDQGRRITVGDTGVLATSSVLAVAGDAAGTSTPGRERVKRAAAAVATALEPFFPGGVGRYDEDFNPRAFGDNLTAWGTPVLLIESGGLPPESPTSDLTRLNFVAILRVLEDLARDDLAGHDPAVYEGLERNQRNLYADVVVRGGSIRRPFQPPYRADLAFDVEVEERAAAGCPSASLGSDPFGSPIVGSRIVELGDARQLIGGREVDATGSWIVEPFSVWVEGWPLPGWLDRPTLDALARLGVARVRWPVAAERLVAARAASARRRCAGCPRVEPVVDERPEGGFVLAAPPSTARSTRVEHVLDALAGESWKSWRPSREDDADGSFPFAALLPLWGGGEIGLRRGPGSLWLASAASFLVIAPAAEDDFELDPARSRLEEIWLDGVDVLHREPASLREKPQSARTGP